MNPEYIVTGALAMAIIALIYAIGLSAWWFIFGRKQK
tara:strand:+ start:1096 stop:1206 length:111 start_codon:yes stop_codon:yes gene_type:complete